MFGIVGKPLVRRGALAWFHGVLTYGGKVIEFQSIYEVKKLENYFCDCGNGVLGTIRKPSSKRSAWVWFHGIWTYGGKVIEFQSFYMSLKIRKLLL